MEMRFHDAFSRVIVTTGESRGGGGGGRDKTWEHNSSADFSIHSAEVDLFMWPWINASAARDPLFVFMKKKASILYPGRGDIIKRYWYKDNGF